ncbi:5-methyltetrahydropteroyltriglutamate--homocysteine methyltransferase [Aerococcus agrisoli]|uniref:5-methyltetrahydropteroyltriglutamate--homocysteine methyltransferase n=1 Tax=Aerococcus agrisoli TaxID=2487350 RepID=A0A3N4G1I7_9LACT|nr:5-methyltetrahydropteroyltriglutamate--homocysteine methyltransferase [Aerococcus agrisoli]RPA56833.1 5-methyltetrahydropteroyltriglutamate--homocysteine methyltransferase [Aerococcus agrisoli]
MTHTHTSKRFLTVGSLLRPEDLLAYKSEIEHRDDIQYPFYNDFDNYKETEDKAVADVVAKENALDFPEITDGEYSKSLWHLDFFWGFGGVRRFIADKGYVFVDFDEENPFETRKDIGIEIVEPLSGKNHPFIDHYKRLVELNDSDSAVKVCIPSPGHMFTELNFNPQSYLGVYANAEDFRQGVIKAYKEFLDEYVAAGGEIIQLDDCLWTIHAEDSSNSPFRRADGTWDDAAAAANAEAYVALNNAVIDYGHELGLKVYTHNCRGNYASRHAGDGSYNKIANFFLKNQRYDRFYLEWDDDRAGDISALDAFKDNDHVEVVLGLLSSKTADLDDEERALRSLEEATKYVPKERLYLSHQCGFASCDGGNVLTTDNQWDKIKQGQSIAFKYFGE